MKFFLSFAAALILLFSIQSFAPPAKLPYQDPTLPIAKRLDDLLSRMTLEEKIAQMCQYVGPEHVRKSEAIANQKQLKNNDADGFYPGLGISGMERLVEQGMIGSFLHVLSTPEANHLQRLAQKSRLKIPLLIGIDAIHGNGMISGSTIYPSPIGLSCTWDTSLVKRISRYTALEMRESGMQWAFAPNLDVARDARWGRVGETFGEDPLLVSFMGAATIQGLQLDGKLGNKGVLACAKHLIAGSEPVNGLNKAPTDVSERTLKEIYLPPFKMAIDGLVATVMPAHNEINGIPCHAHRYLMNDLLRDKWGFKGFYISDFMDIERLAEIHHTAIDQKELAYLSVRAGMDMHMQGPGFFEAVLALVKEGKITSERVEQSARRILETKFRLGLFEHPLVDEAGVQPNKTHLSATLEAAQKSIVLLKNNGILPLQMSKYRKILVTGPNASNQALLGDWSLEQPAEKIVTVLDGLREAALPSGSIIDFFDTGSSILDMDAETVAKAEQAAHSADLIIAIVGDNSLRYKGKRTAGENVDRDNIGLPGLQPQLIEALHKSGKPMVVVLVNGRPLSSEWMEVNVPAIVESWESGSLGGRAIADVLTGKVNPSGKLTISFPRNAGQIATYYNHKPSHYVREYIDSKTGPLYEFGYGLSYTTFKYGSITLNKPSIKPAENLVASVEVTNMGEIAGEETVQLYLNGSTSTVEKPVKELRGFQKLQLKPGEKKIARFILKPASFFSYDEQNKYRLEEGIFTVMIGGSSRDRDLQSVKVKITAK